MDALVKAIERVTGSVGILASLGYRNIYLAKDNLESAFQFYLSARGQFILTHKIYYELMSSAVRQT